MEVYVYTFLNLLLTLHNIILRDNLRGNKHENFV